MMYSHLINDKLSLFLWLCLAFCGKSIQFYEQTLTSVFHLPQKIYEILFMHLQITLLKLIFIPIALGGDLGWRAFGNFDI